MPSMGGIGKGSGNTPMDAGALLKPATDVAKKAALAGKVKSIKLKIKMKPNGK